MRPCWRSCFWARRFDGVVSRPGLALGGGLIAALAFAGASMAWRIQQIGEVLSLAYPPIALVCLDRALARASIIYGAAAGLVAAFMALGRDRSRCWPSIPGRLRALAHAVPVALTALLAEEFNRTVIDYTGAGRGSLHPALLLTAVMPDLFGAARAAWRTTGAAELRVGRHRPLHRPEHGRALHRRGAAAAAGHGGDARGAVGARDPVLCGCRHRDPGLCARPFHAALVCLLPPAAGGEPFPAAGGCNVPPRRPCRHPCRLRRPSAASRRARHHRAQADCRHRRRAGACVRRRRGTGGLARPPRSPSAACRGRRPRLRGGVAGTDAVGPTHRAPAGAGGRHSRRRYGRRSRL